MSILDRMAQAVFQAQAASAAIARFELSDEDYHAARDEGRMHANYGSSDPKASYRETRDGFTFMGVSVEATFPGGSSRLFYQGGGDGRGAAIPEVRFVPVTGVAEADSWVQKDGRTIEFSGGGEALSGRETLTGFQALSRPLTPGSDEPSS